MNGAVRKYRWSEKMAGEAFHVIDTPLTFSPEKIELTLAPGEIREERFTIYGPKGSGVEGYCMSSKPCVFLLTDHFAGSMDEVGYRVDASYFEDGDEIEGYFRVFSTNGEYKIPYHIHVETKEISSGLGNLKNLSHFYNLAKTDYAEAAQLFYSPEFAAFVAKSDEETFGIYRGLSVMKGNLQNVEEFLIATQNKKPVDYLPESSTIRTELPSRYATGIMDEGASLLEYSFKITRNGWGYTRLKIEVIGDFLSTDAELIEEADFQGNVYPLQYYVDPEALHMGKNFGLIKLSSPFATTNIPVEITVREKTLASRMKDKEKKELTLKLMRDYEKFRFRKVSGKEWLEETNALIARLGTFDRSDPVPALYEIHALLTGGNKKEALQKLMRLNRRLAEKDPRELGELSLTQYTQEEDAVFCYRIYLTALCEEEDEELVGTAEQKIREKMRRNPSDWRIAWLYMYLSGEYNHLPQEKLDLLQNLYERGTNSPVLWIEAYSVYHANPAMILELDDFTMQTLWYAAKHRFLSDEVLTQLNFLSKRQKTFSEKLYKVLTEGYAGTELASLQTETLESICSLLIKGNLSDEVYFPWYQKGVAQGLQITRLYEYYMMSLPEDFDGELPREILMYFAYQTDLPYTRTAYLYRYVDEHRGAYPDLFMQYEQGINAFTLEQLKLTRQSKDLSYLYDRFLMTHALDKESAEKAAACVYGCVIRTNRPGIRKVILIYDKTEGEESYPIENGVCYLPVYGEDNHIFFEDRLGNRYATSIAYTLDRMMDHEKLSTVLSHYHIVNEQYDLLMMDLSEEHVKLNAEQASQLKQLTLDGRLSGSYYHKAMDILLAYYDEKDALREMDTLLESAKPEDFPASMRGAMIRYLVLGEKKEKAYKWVRLFDTYEVEDDTLFRLCSRLIAEQAAPQEDAFAEIAFEAFSRGKYDGEILEYLSEEFVGLSEELIRVRKAMKGFDLPTRMLSKRILEQLLYTGETMPEEIRVLREYAEAEGDSGCVAAFLGRNAHYALMKDSSLREEEMSFIEHFGRDGIPLADVSRIAYLKRLSERAGEFTSTEQEVVRLFLSDLLRKGIVFPFYRQFIGFVRELQAYANETLVEYRDRTLRGGPVVYHYAMEDGGNRGEFKKREMTQMYEGMYVTGFTLFFGEQMHYFITDDPEEKNIVESGTIGQDARIPEQTEDRFGRVNRIAYMASMHKDVEALSAMKEYDHMSFVVSKLFPVNQKD